jgi:hypothetical protein
VPGESGTPYSIGVEMKLWAAIRRIATSATIEIIGFRLDFVFLGGELGELGSAKCISRVVISSLASFFDHPETSKPPPLSCSRERSTVREKERKRKKPDRQYICEFHQPTIFTTWTSLKIGRANQVHSFIVTPFGRATITFFPAQISKSWTLSPIFLAVSSKIPSYSCSQITVSVT